LLLAPQAPWLDRLSSGVADFSIRERLVVHPPRMKTIAIAFGAMFLVGGSTAARADVFVEDSFESADMSAPDGPAPAINTIGFSWAANNRTSVVTQDAVEGAVVVYNNGVVHNVVGFTKDWTAYDGDYCLRFRYPADSEWAEQRFSLGAKCTDLWLRYWARVPINFTHGSLNNKWLALWNETYDVPGDVTWQTRPDGNGGARLVVQDGGVTGGESLSAPFITTPDDRGRWMQVVVHVKAASAAGANDGVIQLYRRWSGEAQFTKLQEKLDANTWESGATPGIASGYFMGWANDPYTEETEWLIDDVTFSTTSLLDVGSSAHVPSPPMNLRVGE